jgi:hypothetical protein
MTATVVANRHPETVSKQRRRADDAFARAVAERRAGLSQYITLAMVKQVIDMLFSRALEGHIAAARLFLQYAVGKPEAMTPEEPQESPLPSPDAFMNAALAALDPALLGDALAAALESRAPAADQTERAAPAPTPDQTVRTGVETTARPTGSNGSSPTAAGSSGSSPIQRPFFAPNTPVPAPASRPSGHGG